ncbi:MAG: hypothetical protein KAR57_07230 [Bacteroidales bacterium]|nr:hypothetical protein [Bacteroidales bacterium]
MSRTKDYLMDLEEQAEDRHIAKLLGISYDELLELDWKLDTNESKDGLINSYRIEFSENSSKEVLEKIDRLEDGCRVHLENWELEADYDYINDQFDAITESRINQISFNKELKNLKELSQLQNKDDKLKKILNRQIFIAIIGSMETFLSETFLKLVFEEEKYFQSFVETHPEYGSRKFSLREIFVQQKQLEPNVKKTILDTIFHNLSPVSNMFRATFEINFPKIDKMSKHVIVRHDLVHRNGKTKNGTESEIDDNLIDTLIKDTKEFIEEICKELKIK